MVKMQNVMIKGTKDGLLLRLDDSCSFTELMDELENKLSLQQMDDDESHKINVRIHTGNRYLSKEQEEQIVQLINSRRNFNIESIDANVMLKSDVERIKLESEITLVNKVVRSGQILEVVGDLLLVGDVNPGGIVRAGGNIFILGALKGIAHAGIYGNDAAVICASNMVPTQLRISEYFTRAPDRGEEGNHQEAECAYINQDKQIVIDRLKVLKHIRPSLNRFMEGGL